MPIKPLFEAHTLAELAIPAIIPALSWPSALGVLAQLRSFRNKARIRVGLQCRNVEVHFPDEPHGPTPQDAGPFFRRNFTSRNTGIKQKQTVASFPRPKANPGLAWWLLDAVAARN